MLEWRSASPMATCSAQATLMAAWLKEVSLFLLLQNLKEIKAAVAVPAAQKSLKKLGKDVSSIMLSTCKEFTNE